MKKLRSVFYLGLTATLLLIAPLAFSQNGEPPPPPGEHGQTGDQPAGGGAAIDGGLLILAALGGGYGIRKYIRNRRKIAE
ncbi:MAG: hypothetical protein EOM83_16630 [Clostridia bacterium]|nr:hypothetical protein [Clostridia bacterium]